MPYDLDVEATVRKRYDDAANAIEPFETTALEDATEFDCRRTAKRHPCESKGLEYNVTEVGEICGPDGDCC